MTAIHGPLRRRRPAAPGREFSIPVAMLLLALPVIACGTSQEFAVGSPAPVFELATPDGESIALEDFTGTPTVVNFWATWCAPCVKEMPELEALAASGTVDVIGIALDEGEAEPVRRFAEELGVSYPIALGNQELFLAYRGFGVPYTVLLDADLVVRKTYRGPVSREMLIGDVESMSEGN